MTDMNGVKAIDNLHQFFINKLVITFNLMLNEHMRGVGAAALIKVGENHVPAGLVQNRCVRHVEPSVNRYNRGLNLNPFPLWEGCHFFHSGIVKLNTAPNTPSINGRNKNAHVS